jgi:1,4-alpha-glucan branching enzyme
MYTLKSRIGLMLPLIICAPALAAVSPSRMDQAPAPPNKAAARSGGPKVLSDGQVKFLLNAPNASKVMLNMQTSIGPSPAATPTSMTKDATGVWSVTVGPLTPNFYGYGFMGCLASQSAGFSAASFPLGSGAQAGKAILAFRKRRIEH